MEKKFEKNTFGKRLKTMLKADTRRLFGTTFFYIMLVICLVMPILILTMTTMFGGAEAAAEPSMDTFTNTWQAISAMSDAGMSMGLPGMCNMNMMYFALAVLVCVFVSGDFGSGYAKNLFTVRSKKTDYVISKTIVCFLGGAGMILAFFIGSMLGGAIAGLSFDLGTANIGNVVMCMLSKLLLIGVFVPLYLVFSVAAKQRTWLSILLSLGVGMFLFMMIPMMTPLDATLMNIILCLAGAGLLSFGLGAVSNTILKKTSLV